ncbi:MAG: GGDEF domain-containing protein [Acidobacteriaceae bacterium]
MRLQRISMSGSGPLSGAGLRGCLFRAFGATALLLGATLHAAAASSPPTLHTASQVRRLSRSQAAQGYPVHLGRAQVLFLNARALFVQDGTDGLSADLQGETLPALYPGDLITLDGVSGPGDSVPVILHPAIRLLGHAPLPSAPETGFDRLSSGTFQSRWVAVEGVLQSATPADPNDAGPLGLRSLQLMIANGEDHLQVHVPGLARPAIAGLVDARVRLRAVVENLWNPRKLLVGTVLSMPDLSCLQILNPPPLDPFALPLIPVEDMTTIRQPDHRVHVRGVVTSAWDDRNFSLMDARRGTFVETVGPAVFRIGDVVDVAGFPSEGDYTAYLSGALVRVAGSAPVEPGVRLTAAVALTGAHDAEPIEVQGDLLRETRGADGIVTLFLSEAGTPFQAVLPPGNRVDGLAALRPGSRLRVFGICVIHADRDHIPQRLDILLRSATDVRVLRSPGWWTFGRVAIAAVLLLAIVLVIAVWNAVLRGRVRAQTRRIQAQLEEARSLRALAEAAHQEKSSALANLLAVQQDLLAAQEKLRYQASHDALTGLWNRPALLDFLHKEIERACRHAIGLGILLLDADHFKAVNDTRGHLAGDEALHEIALRISRAIRPYDIAGRYGGEEFLIILPECGREETESIAERIRLTIAATPFVAGASSFPLTASIGATVNAGSVPAETILLNQADLALYEAKSAGRNCTVVYAAAASPAR